jgi:hypothetical protein
LRRGAVVDLGEGRRRGLRGPRVVRCAHPGDLLDTGRSRGLVRLQPAVPRHLLGLHGPALRRAHEEQENDDDQQEDKK